MGSSRRCLRRRPAVYRVAIDILGLEDALDTEEAMTSLVRLPEMLPVTILKSVMATPPPAIERSAS